MEDLTAVPLRAPQRGDRSITILVVSDVVNRFNEEEGHDPALTRTLVNDFVARDKYGYDKYHQNLEAHDGRPTVWDLYQELLDGCQYSRKQIEEGLVLPGMENVYPTLLELTRITRQAILNIEGEENALRWEKPSETEDSGNAISNGTDDAKEYRKGIFE